MAFNNVRRFIGLRLHMGIYTRSIPFSLDSKKIEIVQLDSQTSMPGPTLSLEPYFHPLWMIDLRKCFKNGGYKKLLMRNYWSHNSLKYFNFEMGIFGGVPNLITSSSICLVRNVNYFPEMIEPNNVSKYTFSLRRSRAKESKLPAGFAFNFSGSNSFQHFIQDCMPILAASKEFLINNPDLPILAPKFHGDSKIRDQLIKLLDIKNEIIETTTDCISIRELYFWNFKPFGFKYSIPEIFYSILQRELDYIYSKKKSSKLVLITRKEQTRNFANEEEVIFKCSLLAQKLGLELVVINSKEASFEDWLKQLPEAKVVIGMHGGALFNLILSKPGTLLFEFVSTTGTDSVINTFTRLGIKVVPIPIQSTKNQTSDIEVPCEVFDEILKIANLFRVNQST